MRRVLAILCLILAVACHQTPATRTDESRTSPSNPTPARTSSKHVGAPTPTPSEGRSASGRVPPGLVGTEWTTLPTTNKVVALTFDTGANNAGVDSILRTLGQSGTPATFFLTGKWTELYPDQARTIGRSYPVGNHTQTHPYLTTLSGQEVRAEISDAGERIRAATGEDDRPLFRFPYGDSDARTIGIANNLGYGAIRWTIDTLGWKGTSGGESVDRVVDRVLDGLRPGAIVLMHVGSNPVDGTALDAEALPRLIQGISARGYAFVTVAAYL